MLEELQDRPTQLDAANALFESSLGILKAGVIVVDPKTRIQVWNARCADMWGLREDEVTSQHLFGLDIGLPLDKLREPVQQCLSGQARSAELSTDAINRRGRPVLCRVTITPRTGPGGQVQGAILLVEEEQDRS